MIEMDLIEIDSSDGSADEWNGPDDQVVLKAKTLCLFCSEVFDDPESMFMHCHPQHTFDFVTYSRRMGFTCISYVKFVNFMRSFQLPSFQLDNISKDACPWIDDSFMKPHNPEDALLTFDIESYLEEKLMEDENEPTITIPQSHFESLVQKLAYKEMKLENAYDRIDKMKDAAKSVLLSNESQPSKFAPLPRQINHHPQDEEDDHYFSTYDHFAIHHEMLQDKVRTTSYQEAILQNSEIFQNKRVLDVGCGTGILSLFAAKSGASKVIAVDKSDIIYQAMDIVRENDFENVIDVFRGRIEDIPVPEEKVDIILSEWMGYFLLFEGMMDSVLYARDKFLKPGGLMFPDRCTISLLAVCDMDKYKEYVKFWDDVYGFKMSAIKRDVFKEANVEAIKSNVICSDSVIVKNFDLNTCPSTDAEFSSSVMLTMSRSCSVTAIVGYFDCFFEKGLQHKVVLSTSPKSPATHWKQTMFLLPEPVEVKEGEQVSCKIYCRRNRRDPRSLIVQLSFGDFVNKYYLS